MNGLFEDESDDKRWLSLGITTCDDGTLTNGEKNDGLVETDTIWTHTFTSTDVVDR